MKAVLSWSALIAFLLLFSLSAKVFRNFRQSPVGRLNRVTIACLDREGKPFLFSLEQKKALLVALPATAKVQVPFGFGEYELSKVYPLGQLEKKGGDLLTQTIRRNFSVVSVGYLRDSSLSLNEIFQRPDSIKSVFRQALKSKETNFSRYDLLILIWRTFGLNQSQFSKAVYSENLKEDFQDSRLRKEAFSVEVLNATEHNGLAQSEADFLENSGLRVVRVADAPEKIIESKVILNHSDLAESYTLFWLKLIYHYPFENGENKNRADITVILGEDYWKMMSEKW